MGAEDAVGIGARRTRGLKAPKAVIPNDVVYNSLYWLLNRPINYFLQISYEGEEFLPKKGPAFIFAEHGRRSDTPAIIDTVKSVTGQNPRFFLKAELLGYRAKGWKKLVLSIFGASMRLTGNYPVDRRWPHSPMNLGAYEYIEDRVIEHGDFGVIYPRGTRSEGGGLKSGFIGATVEILERHPERQIPVLTALVSYKDASFPRACYSHVTLGGNIYVPGMSKEELTDKIELEFARMRNQS